MRGDCLHPYTKLLLGPHRVSRLDILEYFLCEPREYGVTLLPRSSIL